MTLIDTSVLGQSLPVAGLVELIAAELAGMHPFVAGELAVET